MKDQKVSLFTKKALPRALMMKTTLRSGRIREDFIFKSDCSLHSELPPLTV